MSTERRGAGHRPEPRSSADSNPIQPGEERDLVAGVEAFLRKVASDPDARHAALAEPLARAHRPAQLIRRFLLRPPAQPGGSWLPWEELGHRDQQRLSDAFYFWQLLARQQQWDDEGGHWTLTPAIVTHDMARFNEPHGVTFDLHDVYVCAESVLLELRDEHERNQGSQRSYNALMSRYGAVRDAIGEAL